MSTDLDAKGLEAKRSSQASLNEGFGAMSHKDDLSALPPCDGVGVKALHEAEQAFEEIRLVLIKELNEPGRSAFWKAVNARDAIRSALTAVPADEDAAKAGAVPVASQPARVTYTNWRGETAKREIKPKRLWFGSTQWHPEPQWFISAVDLDKGAERDFALSGFGSAVPRVLPASLIKVEQPTREDEAEEVRLNAASEAIERAKQAGLSDDDIALIRRSRL